MVVNGSLISAVTVNANGTLGGTGHLSSGTVNGGGHLAPGNGNSGALIVAGNLDFESGELDIVGAGSSVTSVSIAGNLRLNGVPTLNVTGNLAAGQYIIASYGGILSGQFADYSRGRHHQLRHGHQQLDYPFGRSRTIHHRPPRRRCHRLDRLGLATMPKVSLGAKPWTLKKSSRDRSGGAFVMRTWPKNGPISQSNDSHRTCVGHPLRVQTEWPSQKT